MQAVGLAFGNDSVAILFAFDELFAVGLARGGDADDVAAGGEVIDVDFGIEEPVLRLGSSPVVDYLAGEVSDVNVNL